MKKDTHPDYVETAVTCTCGASFTTRSTATSGKLHADVCSQCHPFYTGKQKILDTGGRVARFEARYAKKSAAAAGDLREQVVIARRRSPALAGGRRLVVCPATGSSGPGPGSRESAMFEAVEGMRAEHADLEGRLSLPETHADQRLAKQLNQRYAELTAVVTTWLEWQRLADDIEAARELGAIDPAFAEEADTLTRPARGRRRAAAPAAGAA